MAKREAYLEWPLSEPELLEVLNALHDRNNGLKAAISGESQFIMKDSEIKVKIANVNLAMAKFQRALWKVQAK